MRQTAREWTLEAFGVDDLGDQAPPGVDRWVRAVALGARGRAAAARTVLADIDGHSPILTSLASCARASLVRQSGRHALARAGDGRACLAVSGGPRDVWARAAWLDALIGLAADNLGVGAFAASNALLTRVGAELDAIGPDRDVSWVTIPRVRLRHAWVRTEHALYSGDTPASIDWGTRATHLADDAPSPRHRIKTDLITAASDAAGGRVDAAVRRAHDVENRCRERGLLPLQWAAATMLAGIDASDVRAQVRADEALAAMSSLGMSFATGA
ncbi:hypothetical protein nbrc107696_23300 [Gordonia spumicola]|uniref:Uncharacterized protein n=1 Tax=Gordonia spumicola TaxID=589161 RepID=A0A7I9V9G6_9ACTN|nr:hypothetical protein [Gordonia spumicola]GEE01884.1 hypothetical protein nbrc107696_23300 [Gordonia spumicola]